MNFFEKELQKMVNLGIPVTSPKYVGGACYGKLDDDLRIKLQFVTLGHAEHYEAIKATVINRVDGPVDSAIFRFSDVLGKKQVSNPNFTDGITPYAWAYYGKIDWYVYRPTAQDYKQLFTAVNDYCGIFQTQQMADRGMQMSQQF
jgi:hypothetical protein